MVDVTQNTFEIEMKGKTNTILLPFTKQEILASAYVSNEMKVGNANNSVTIYHKLKSERVAGADEVEFPCKCKGKHPTEFLSVDG